MREATEVKFDLSVTMQLQEESEFIILARQDMPAINNITLPGKTFWMNCASFSILFTVFFLCIERSLTPYYHTECDCVRRSDRTKSNTEVLVIRVLYLAMTLYIT